MAEEKTATHERIQPESKVGLSLSFCVKDILRGNVQEEEVKQVISATKVETPKDWDKLIASYKKTYWDPIGMRTLIEQRQLLGDFLMLERLDSQELKVKKHITFPMDIG